jgi:hypothetical protein
MYILEKDIDLSRTTEIEYKVKTYTMNCYDLLLYSSNMDYEDGEKGKEVWNITKRIQTILYQKGVQGLIYNF